MMSVDQAGQNYVAVMQVQYFIRALWQLISGADMFDHTITDENGAVSYFTACAIHCHQGMDVLD